VTKDVPTKTTPRDHPEGVVDLEDGMIASEDLTTSDGVDISHPFPRESIDGADEAGGDGGVILIAWVVV
jgi:hypothetical protein